MSLSETGPSIVNATVFLLFTTDFNGDETYEGAFVSREAAEEQADFIREWDVTLKDHRVLEDYVRETCDD